MIIYFYKEENEVKPPLKPIKESFQLSKTHMVNVDLHNAVLDFEQTLEKSKTPDIHISSSIREPYETFGIYGSSPSHKKITMSTNTPKSGGGIDKDLHSPTHADLQNIREQMALSLERTKILEELVKHIPLLQAQVAELKEEKRQLLSQVKTNKDQHQFVNGRLHANPNLSPYLNQQQDSGIAYPSLTINGGLNVVSSKLANRNSDKYADKWYREKSNFLHDITSNTSSHKRSAAILVTKETQTTLPRYKKDSSIQTLNNSEINSINSVQESKKVFKSVGMSACVLTADTSTEAIAMPVSSIGVSDDTIDVILCPKCAFNVISENTSTFPQDINKELRRRTIGCQHNTIIKNVSVQCETIISNRLEKTIVSVATNTDSKPPQDIASIGCQYEISTLHKICQVDLKLKDKAVQYDIPDEAITNEFCSKSNDSRMKNIASIGCQYEISTVHKICQVDLKLKDKAVQYDLPYEFCSKSNDNRMTTSIDSCLAKQENKISLSSLSVPRSKSFCSIDTSPHRSIGCQHVSENFQKATQVLLQVEQKSTQCEDISYFTKFKTKLGSKESTSENETFDTSPLSRIPRRQLAENKRLLRQDTYNIDLSKTLVDLQIKDAVAENMEVIEDESNSTPSNVTPSNSKPHLDSNMERKKAVPSKSMRAALKVLGDCLKKGQTQNFEDQLKNSIDIVQLEWFKISSLIDANPLDVEDYLDYFENISFNLLEYIVNMVDANGNTAMHYAVSHGNFDIVSILLDSKVCDINQTNKVGYTTVMLMSLVEISSLEHANVVQRLFKLADVNVKAKQHGQTALMLAVSHGRCDMVKMLLEAGADMNIRDEDGSTALMCAAEHGHINIVKLFLEQPECDSTISDMDGSTALTIAMEAGHRPIGVLLYTHQRVHQSSSAVKKFTYL